MAFCGQEGAMLRIPWNNLRTTQSNLLRSQHLKEGGCHPCDVPQFEPCTWRQSRGMAYTLSHWPLEFKDAMNVGIQDASWAMKTSAGHGQKFGLRSEGRRFACLAEKRFREERKRWVCSVEPRKLMIGGSFPAAWNMPIHTVNVNVEASDYFLLIASHWMSKYVNLGFHTATGKRTATDLGGLLAWRKVNEEVGSDGLPDRTTNLLSTAIRW